MGTRRSRSAQWWLAVVLALSGMLGAPAVAGAGTATPVVTVHPLTGLPSGVEMGPESCLGTTWCLLAGAWGTEPFFVTSSTGTLLTGTPRALALPPSMEGGAITGVSCSSSVACVAIGNDGVGQPFVVLGSPATWTGASVRVFGTSADAVEGLSCSSATWCVAVGSVGVAPAVVSGNPAQWGVSSMRELSGPTTSGALATLSAVACTSSTRCLAVGGDDLNQAPNPILLAGDPSTWTGAEVVELDHVALPTDAQDAGGNGVLAAVACPSPAQCVAVGSIGTEPLVVEATVDGAVRLASSIGLPDVDGSINNALATISCTSATSCVAIGSSFQWYRPSSVDDNQLIGLTGNPNLWSTANADVALSSDIEEVGPTSVSCQGQTCLLATSTSSWSGTIERLSTGGLRKLSSQSVASTNLEGPSAWSPYQVASSCPTAASCVVLGPLDDENHETLSVLGSPLAWGSAVAHFAPATWPVATLAAVSCPTSTTCVAVGQSDLGQPTVWVSPPASLWHATPRVLSLARSSAFGNGGSLSSISCPSAAGCVAVGADAEGDPVVVSGAPSSWSSASFRRLAAPRSGAGVQLTGLSCVALTSCTAAGNLGGNPMVLVGNPAAWTTTAAIVVGHPSGSPSSLTAVSCVSATWCTAVASDGAATAGYLTGNPATWRTATLLSFAGSAARGASLAGVTCASTTSCVVAGTTGDGSFAVASGDPRLWGTSGLSTPEWASAMDAPAAMSVTQAGSMAAVFAVVPNGVAAVDLPG